MTPTTNLVSQPHQNLLHRRPPPHTTNIVSLFSFLNRPVHKHHGRQRQHPATSFSPFPLSRNTLLSFDGPTSRLYTTRRNPTPPTQHPFSLVHCQRAISRCRLAGDGAGDEESRDFSFSRGRWGLSCWLLFCIQLLVRVEPGEL